MFTENVSSGSMALVHDIGPRATNNWIAKKASNALNCVLCIFTLLGVQRAKNKEKLCSSWLHTMSPLLVIVHPSLLMLVSLLLMSWIVWLLLMLLHFSHFNLDFRMMMIIFWWIFLDISSQFGAYTSTRTPANL